MRKSLLVAFLTAMVCGFALAGILNFCTVQAATEVIGILTSDTTWTKANSPYNLTGPTAVSEGVTLTIEAGATVNLNDYYIQINGTLRASGSSTDKIYFNGGSDTWPNYAITFTSSSSDWNEQTGSGSIIENAILSSTRISISNASPKINDNSIIIVASMMESSEAIMSSGGSPIITNNNIKGGVSSSSGSAVISYNTVTGGMGIYGGSPTIAYNNISGGSTYFWIGRSQERNYNVMYINGEGSAVISNNYITGNGGGILFDAGEHHEESIRYAPLISGNTIYNCGTGISIGSIAGTLIIERNLISNNGTGISIRHDANLIIRSNTITENAKGISVEYLTDEGFSKEILNNNIYANKDYNFYLEGPNDINATYNWWGTTDTQAINQTIYDVKYDFNLGTVTFVPFLTEPNPEAMPDPNAPIPTPPEQTPATSPTPTPDQTPTPTPSQEPQQTEQLEIIVGVVIAVAVIGAGLGLLIYLIKRK